MLLQCSEYVWFLLSADSSTCADQTPTCHTAATMLF